MTAQDEAVVFEDITEILSAPTHHQYNPLDGQIFLEEVVFLTTPGFGGSKQNADNLPPAYKRWVVETVMKNIVQILEAAEKQLGSREIPERIVPKYALSLSIPFKVSNIGIGSFRSRPQLVAWTHRTCS
jgi:hypothetical protein